MSELKTKPLHDLKRKANARGQAPEKRPRKAHPLEQWLGKSRTYMCMDAWGIVFGFFTQPPQDQLYDEMLHAVRVKNHGWFEWAGLLCWKCTLDDWQANVVVEKSIRRGVVDLFELTMNYVGWKSLRGHSLRDRTTPVRHLCYDGNVAMLQHLHDKYGLFKDDSIRVVFYDCLRAAFSSSRYDVLQLFRGWDLKPIRAKWVSQQWWNHDMDRQEYTNKVVTHVAFDPLFLTGVTDPRIIDYAMDYYGEFEIKGSILHEWCKTGSLILVRRATEVGILEKKLFEWRRHLPFRVAALQGHLELVKFIKNYCNMGTRELQGHRSHILKQLFKNKEDEVFDYILNNFPFGRHVIKNLGLSKRARNPARVRMLRMVDAWLAKKS